MNELRHYGRHDELLEVTCWCERYVGLVTDVDVWAGRTWSHDRYRLCRPGCPKPNREEE